MSIKKGDTVEHDNRIGKVLKMNRGSTMAYIKFETLKPFYPFQRRAWVKTSEVNRLRSKGEPRGG